MIIGLKRGVVELTDHDPEWEKLAAQTIERLWRVFGSAAKDIQHVGSTAITSIKAKPIIDIVVGVQKLNALDGVFPRLEADGFYQSLQHAVPNDILYVLGSAEDDLRTHHIHIVEMDGIQWKNYIGFRDYLNACPPKALEYEKVKAELAQKYSNDRISYTNGKEDFFEKTLIEARLYADRRFLIQWVDGVSYKLKSPFDFSFLSKYGKVFKVFDDQGSGNICFGVQNGDKRYFVKFAGASTANYTGTTENAIERLKRVVTTYRDLAHPNLIKLVNAEDIADGYAVIFDWVDAVHMWTPVFQSLSLDKRYTIFDSVLDFHVLVAQKGYCVLDLYEDHILWDIQNEKVVICDIDFYSKGWYKGMSGIWNTDCEWYFPEQFVDGAPIDEISCVYVMGAMAFALFGDGRDRTIEKWKLNKNSFAVALKAVSDERSRRQQSIEQFIEDWRVGKEGVL